MLLLALLLLIYLLFFAVGKVGFLLYNAAAEPFTLTDACQVWWHGLGMDASTCGYALIVPWLLCLIALWVKRLPMRRILLPYYIIIAFLMSLIVCGDMFLYEFWKFKLNASIFAYMQNAEGAANSVSTGYIVSRVSAILMLAVALGWTTWRITPRNTSPSRHRLVYSLLMVLVGGLVVLMIRGGVHTSTMNVGQAYYSQRLYLNHAAVNPVFSLLSSIKRTQNYAEQFNYFDEEERDALFRDLYPAETEDITDTLLTTQRPNILIVLMESFGGKMVKELGGRPDVAPCLSKLIQEGVFWENYFSNSFRTDRGTVSAFAGWISYPSVSLMRLPQLLPSLSALPLTLQRQGYSTHYLYGGDIQIMGKKGYLVSAGYQQFTSDKDFSFAEANSSKWGVTDSITAMRAKDIIAATKGGAPFMMTYQTISSHEPWEVPYHRIADEVANAFAYTDHCIGQLVDSLRTSPVWENLLVVLIPDHGIAYHCGYDDPLFFHSPMLWVGGAVRKARRIPTIMNQSDMAATLLSQMGIPHRDYPWSRNVLSKSYTYPFAYSTYPSGILFCDSTGLSIYDINGQQPILEQGAGSEERIRRAKAILQTSYDKLSVEN